MPGHPDASSPLSAVNGPSRWTDDDCRTDPADTAGRVDPDGESEPLVLVTMNDYRPGTRFEVIERLPAPITVSMLASPVDEQPPVLPRPDEYVGYVGRSVFDGGQVRAFPIVFARSRLEREVGYEFERDAGVFSVELRLLRATARRIGPDGGGESPPV